MGNTGIFRFTLTFFICLICDNIFSQNYPYLNASSGCEGQYIVDADTNVFMYHGNQLEKYDKNFNPIWVKQYDSLLFHTILLSKTGSLYFISNTSIYSNAQAKTIGKIDKNGNISWCNTLNDIAVMGFPSEIPTCKINHVILDRNNDLVFTGKIGPASHTNEYLLFLKTDTLGNIINFKTINSPNNTIFFDKVITASDSAGNYKLVWNSNLFEASGAGMFNYNEILDTIPNQFMFMGAPFSTQDDALYLISKRKEGVFYSVISWCPNYNMPGVHKINITKHYKDTVVWSKNMDYTFYLGPIKLSSIDEDENKNLIFTLTNSQSDVAFENLCFKVDSSGNMSVSKKLLNYVCWPPSSSNNINAKLNVLYGEKYYYNVYGCNFTSNPQTVSILDSTINSACSSALTYSLTDLGFGSGSGNFFDLQINDVIVNSVISNTITTFNVNNFSIIPNYCNSMSVETKAVSNTFKVYPNPTSKIINIEFNNSDEKIESSIFDFTGKAVLVSDLNSINVSHLSSGIYFIKIKTDQGEFNQKFIKE